MRQFDPIRRSPIAGTWYPADRQTLVDEVDAHLAAAEVSSELAASAGGVTALIAPHAGLVYSGPVAGHAYRAVVGRKYEVVVVVGPSHFARFDGVSIYPRGAFGTPMGPIPIEEGTAGRLLQSAVVVEYTRAHEREHSVEMQLPFLGRVLPETPIVPLVMGDQTRETVNALATTLAETLAGYRALMVASTDLSHYFDAPRAAQLDAVVVGHVNRFDPQGLLDELERYPEQDRGRCVACGGGPAAAVMQAARVLGATRSQVVCRADSGDVSGDRSAVVGYLAAVIGGESE